MTTFALLLIANVQGDTPQDVALGLRALGDAVVAGDTLELEEGTWAVTQGELLRDQSQKASIARANALYEGTETPDEGGIVSLVLGAQDAGALRSALHDLAATLAADRELDESQTTVGQAHSFLAEYSEGDDHE